MSIAFLNKYWTCLFFNRHVDQIILCCFYGVSKVAMAFLIDFVVAAAQPCGVGAQRFANMQANLTANAGDLEDAIKELEAHKKDIKRGIMNAKLKDELNAVKDWITRVEKTILKADSIMVEVRENRDKYTWRCCNARKVANLLVKANLLLEKGKFDNLFSDGTAIFDCLPLPLHFIAPSSFRKIATTIMQEGVRIVGIHDIGSTEDIEEAIGFKLGLLNDEIWNGKNKVDRSLLIYKALKGARYLIIFENVSKELDFLKLGIGFLRNKIKIVLTTTNTNKSIFRHMEVDASFELGGGFTVEEGLEIMRTKYGFRAAEEVEPCRTIVAACHKNPKVLLSVGHALRGVSLQQLNESAELVELEGTPGSPAKLYERLCEFPDSVFHKFITGAEYKDKVEAEGEVKGKDKGKGKLQVKGEGKVKDGDGGEAKVKSKEGASTSSCWGKLIRECSSYEADINAFLRDYLFSKVVIFNIFCMGINLDGPSSKM